MEGKKKEFVDFTITSTDIKASGLTEVLTQEIIKELEPKLVGLPLLEQDRALVGGKGIVRRFRFRKSMSMEDFDENEDVPDVSPADMYSHLDVEPTYFGGGEFITGQAIIDADFNVINDIKSALADAHARKVDSRVWATLFDATLVEDEALLTGEQDWDLAHGNILIVTDLDAPGTASWTLDYAQGHLHTDVVTTGAGTISYVYTTRPVVVAGTPGTLSYEDIVAASTTVVSAKGIPDSIVVDPIGAGDLLVDDKFTHASQLGDQTLTNGKIGRIAGMTVLVSHVMYRGVAFVCQKGKRLGYYVYKQPLQTKIDLLERRPGDVFCYAWEKSIPCVTDENMICVIVNANQLNAYTYTP